MHALTARGADLPFVGFPCLMAANVKAAMDASGGGKEKGVRRAKWRSAVAIVSLK